MQLFTRQLPPECDLYQLSDLHVGSQLTDYERINRAVAIIHDNPRAKAMIVGDLAEAICVDDKRFDIETSDRRLFQPLKQYKHVIELLRPIKDKILLINDGNHDMKLSYTGNFVRDLVCEELGVPYGTYSSKLSVTDQWGVLRFKIFVTHGFGFIRSVADDPIRRVSNEKLTLKRKLAGKAADCVVMSMGHTHKLIVAEPEKSLYLVDDGEHVKQRYTQTKQSDPYIPDSLRWYVNTGSFLKMYALGASGYAERFMLDPVELGFIKIRVDGDVKSVEKFIL